MEASQSPSVANSGDLLRQSSTVSMEARNGSGALQVLRAAAVRADKWKAANVDGHAGWLSIIMHCMYLLRSLFLVAASFVLYALLCVICA